VGGEATFADACQPVDGEQIPEKVAVTLATKGKWYYRTWGCKVVKLVTVNVQAQPHR